MHLFNWQYLFLFHDLFYISLFNNVDKYLNSIGITTIYPPTHHHNCRICHHCHNVQFSPFSLYSMFLGIQTDVSVLELEFCYIQDSLVCHLTSVSCMNLMYVFLWWSGVQASNQVKWQRYVIIIFMALICIFQSLNHLFIPYISFVGQTDQNINYFLKLLSVAVLDFSHSHWMLSIQT